MAEMRVVSCPLCGRVAGQKAAARKLSVTQVGLLVQFDMGGLVPTPVPNHT
jgi:hypothetical protein